MTGRRKPPRAQTQYDATDPEAIKKAEAASALREQLMVQVQAAVLSTPEGREWLYRLLRGTGLFKDRAIHPTEYANGYADGMREIGISMLRALAKANAQTFALMLSENDQ